jgi:hypothetical protein
MPHRIYEDDRHAVEGGPMNALDLLGRQVRYGGEIGVVMGRSEPGVSRRERLANLSAGTGDIAG